MKVKHILVPVDFSSTSDKAVQLASLLSKKLDVEVTLLHVLVLFKADASEVDAKMHQYEQLYEEMARKVEKEIKHRGEHFESNQVHKIVLRGISASDTILDYIASHDVDLVIMGTHGKSGIKHAIQGSVTEKVVRLSPVPVLTVHPDTSSVDFDHILVPIDFSEYSQRALKVGVQWAELYNATIHCIHVVQREIHPAFYAAGISSILELDHEVEKRIKDKMEQLIDSLNIPTKKVKFIIKEGKPVNEILQYAEQNSIDLIVMGTHGLTGLDYILMGSTAEKIVRHARVPVLTIKKEL